MFLFHRKPKPVILPRTQHNISRRDIDPDALKVLYRLSQLGHEAYLVGGSVRDLLLGRKPKDFDVGTDARPNEIRREFRNCFLVGRRFRLAHIVFGKKVIETATFRKAPDPNAAPDDQGLYQAEDNTFGTPEEDALRRDFTVNGLFYDIRTFAVIDYVGGLRDLKARRIRAIGDPNIRFREDPVRMMRALRFAAKLGFDICPADLRAIRRYAPELENASTSRLCEEIQRLLLPGATQRCLRLAHETGVLRALLPTLDAWLRAAPAHRDQTWASLAALDRAAAAREPTPAVAFVALYWPMIRQTLAQTAPQAPEPNPKRARAHLRQARRAAALQAFNPIIHKYRLPRAVWMTALDIIEHRDRFDATPKGTPSDGRFIRHPLYPDLRQGAQLIAALDPARPAPDFAAWDALHVRLAPHGALPNPHAGRRRRPRRGKRKPAPQAPAQP